MATNTNTNAVTIVEAFAAAQDCASFAEQVVANPQRWATFVIETLAPNVALEEGVWRVKEEADEVKEEDEVKAEGQDMNTPPVLSPSTTLHYDWSQKPSRFFGERSTILQFVHAIRLKLFSEQEIFPNKQARLLYCFSLLEGKAKQLILPFISVNLADSEALIDILLYVYHDANIQATALRRISQLRLGNGPLAPFMAEFHLLWAQAHPNKNASNDSINPQLLQLRWPTNAILA